MKLSTSFDNLDDFHKGMERIASRMPVSIHGAVAKAWLLIEIRAKTHHLAGATLKPRTHLLQRSVKTRPPRVVGNTYVGRVGSPVVYAAIHEYGGIIRPKKSKYLVFRIDGRLIRTKQVTIPKRQWLTKSAEDVKPQIESLFGREIEFAIS